MIPKKLKRLAWLGAALTGLFLVAVNEAVAFFGNTVVFPLSPFHIGDKLSALHLYSLHRPWCLVVGHPPLAPLVERAERRHHLPPGLLQAVLEVESASEPHRISPTGAMGLAQLMPGTALDFEVRDPFNSEASVEAAASYLAQLLSQFGQMRLAVAAYNAGPGNVVGGVVPRNGETEHYVPKVMARYARIAPAQLRRYAPSKSAASHEGHAAAPHPLASKRHTLRQVR